MSVESDREFVPAGRADFATTRWSRVLEAGRRSSPDFAHALESLCRDYWYPLYAYVRRRGSSAEDAKDLTQEFFAHFLAKGSLQVADPVRGRFRSFLLTAFKNFLGNQRDRQTAEKRGGLVSHVSIDFESSEDRYRFEPVDPWTAEMLYERRWALHLLERVLQQLAAEYVATGKGDLFDQCKGWLDGTAASYAEAAEVLAMTEGAVRVAVHRLRARYRDLLQAEVRSTVVDVSTTEDELRYLQRAIRGEG